MQENKYRKQYVDRLDVSVNTINKLKENGIVTLEKVCDYNKSDLKKLGIKELEINKTEMNLDFLGLRLRNSL